MRMRLAFQCLIPLLALTPLYAQDEPIIIGDTNAIPLQIQQSTAPVPQTVTPNACGAQIPGVPPPYRFLYSHNYHAAGNGKPEGIYDQPGPTSPKHQIGMVYACFRNTTDCNYSPVWQADLSQPDVHGLDIWDGGQFSNHLQLTWTDGNRIDISRGSMVAGPSPIFPGYGLNLARAPKDLRPAGSDPYVRPKDNTREFRIVIHYCASAGSCTPSDPCASGLPVYTGPKQ